MKKMICYYKLFDYMLRNNISRKYIIENAHVSNATLSKMRKNLNVEMSVIDKLCALLDVQPGDILEFKRD